MSSTELFAKHLLNWYDREGRTDLPWQTDRTLYRVWTSEIMLQQTGVKTVIPYFERFMTRFPDLIALADAPVDDVLALWSGLGYYARARNLHKTAQIIQENHCSLFPETLERVKALPGIGPSTAGAILALSLGQRHPILDGNVKRVLCRYHAVDGWPDKLPVERELWELAEKHTSTMRVTDYTQAIMDLGATVCTRSRPGCATCPVEKNCAALRLGEVDRYPEVRPRRQLPEKSVLFPVVTSSEGSILLEKRPPSGIWGGLWSLPEVEKRSDLEGWCKRVLGQAPKTMKNLPPFRHTFSHFHLNIHPVDIKIEGASGYSTEPSFVWHQKEGLHTLGLPAPVKKLILVSCQP